MLYRILNRFLRSEDASVTVEYVMWLPVIMGFVSLSADATFLLMTQQSMTNAARDMARQVAVGEVAEDDANTVFRSRLPQDKNFSTNVSMSGSFVTASVSVPFSEVTTISGYFLDNQLAANVSMWVEQTGDDDD